MTGGAYSGTPYTATFRCTVTDTASNTDFFDVSVEMTREA
jgi:hypothetical protein